MVSISHVVRKILNEKPLLEESIEKGIINYGGLADMILPEVERELGKKVKHAAVMMAIRRHEPSAYLSHSRLWEKIPSRKSEINVTNGIFEVTIDKHDYTTSIMKEINSLEVISIITGINEISIIARESRRDRIMKIIGKARHVEDELASITIPMPKSAVNSVGIFYHITKRFAWENIPIIEVVSTFSEASFIVKTKNLPRAIKVMTGE